MQHSVRPNFWTPILACTARRVPDVTDGSAGGSCIETYNSYGLVWKNKHWLSLFHIINDSYGLGGVLPAYPASVSPAAAVIQYGEREVTYLSGSFFSINLSMSNHVHNDILYIFKDQVIYATIHTRRHIIVPSVNLKMVDWTPHVRLMHRFVIPSCVIIYNILYLCI